MNRRNVLKGLATVPVAALTRTWLWGYRAPQKPCETHHTLQIILEGAFVVVLNSKTQRLTALVPRHPKHGHNVYFNDPVNPLKQQTANKREEEEYQFALGGDGLCKYSKPYVNPGFRDFELHVARVNESKNLMRIDLPLPNSINFSGRPLHVVFRNRKNGLMPTGHILEYEIEKDEQVKMTCRQLEGELSPSPHSPPGVRRFFFGVAPDDTPEQRCDPVHQQRHAVEFFNFMLEALLRGILPVKQLEAHKLLRVELAHKPCESGAKETSFAWTQPGHLVPAVLRSAAPRPQIRTVSSTVDCQLGGMTLHIPR